MSKINKNVQLMYDMTNVRFNHIRNTLKNNTIGPQDRYDNISINARMGHLETASFMNASSIREDCITIIP